MRSVTKTASNGHLGMGAKIEINIRMSDVKKYFKQQGGFNLIRQYWKGGVLLFAVRQFLLTGKSKTGLELLRMSVELKLKQKFTKKYAYAVKEFVSNNQDDIPHVHNKTVWVLWWQGMDKAPDVVKVCFASIKYYLSDWNIVLLTENNYQNYVTIPDYILKKKDKGIISYAHFADIIRLELLIKYGGLWIDSTVLCTSKDVPISILKSDLFVFQSQKPGADGNATLMSNWLICAKSNHIILRLTLHLLYEYWKKNDYLIDYFFFHKFFTIACEVYSEEAIKIPPFCNSVPHILQLHLFDKFDDDYWNDLRQMTCFHKLTYKLKRDDKEIIGTFYDKLINSGLVKT